MPLSVACPSCNKRLTFYDSQAGTTATCPFCKLEMNVPRQNTVSITTTPAGLDEVSTLSPEAADESSPDELLELGPRWRQVERAFSWVRTGTTLGIAGLGFGFVILLLSVLSGASMSLLIGLSNLIVGAGGICSFIGQLMCLRVPAGARARPAVVINLTARLLAFGPNLYGALSLWDAESTQGSGADEAMLTAFALLLGGWTLSLVADFGFLAVLRRVGLFLEDKTVVRHVGWGVWILIGYIITALIGGAVGIVLTYQSVLERIAAYKAQYAHIRTPPNPQPFSWLLHSLADMLYSRQGAIPHDAQAYLIISAVSTFFSIALATQVLAALNAAEATIKAGLERGSGS